MSIETIALLHPGNMGATIGAAAVTSGARVVWVSENRSEASRRRASEAGLTEIETLGEAARQSDIILSVCPPHAALEVARSVASLRFRGIYVDANAVSRASAEAIGEIVSASGAAFVDGGIIGSPVRKPGTTRLYLSGARAAEVANVFAASMLDARAIGDAPGAASALKICYAAWTKCTDALVLAIRALAAREGVDEALLQEWAISQPALERRSIQAAAVAVPKAWRYVGEMKEIAAALAQAGLPRGFHLAAAELYEKLTPFKDLTNPPPTIAAVVNTINS